MSHRTLRDYGIYCLALTPHQYVAVPVSDHEHITHLLVSPPDITAECLIGPTCYVTKLGRIGRDAGLTQLTTDSLDFTGRYHQP